MVKNVYFFVLGWNRSLTTIDVLNCLKNKGIDFEILEFSEEIIVVNTAEILNDNSLMDELGSSQKIGEVFSVLPTENFAGVFSDLLLKEEFKDWILPKLKKITFGVSVYGKGKDFNQISHQISSLCERIKKEFSSAERKIGYLLIKGSQLSSVSVKKQGLLKNGFELVLIAGKNGVYVGKTTVVQDFESYSFRDYGRPYRDAKAGMTPPKLAKIMINLANKEKDAVILDPFCGSGTILQEAVLLGYKNLLGSDKEEKAVDSTKKNLDWLFENYKNLVRSEFKLEIRKVEVEKLSDSYSRNSIDTIITEPFLGDPKIRCFEEDKIKKEVDFLEELYFQSFKEFKKVLKKEGKVVIIIPVFNFSRKTYYLDLKRILKLGFETRDFIDKEISQKLNLEITSRNSIIFSRPFQTVWREIFIFSLSKLQGEALQC